MEEIRLKIFGSQDLTVFLLDLLSDGDSVYTGGKLVWNFGDSRENVFDMYGDCRENLFEVLAVVIILSTISSVCGESEAKERVMITNKRIIEE